MQKTDNGRNKRKKSKGIHQRQHKEKIENPRERKEYFHVPLPRVEQRKRIRTFSSGSSAAEIEFPQRSRICFSFECALFYYAGVTPAATCRKICSKFKRSPAVMQIVLALNFCPNEGIKLARAPKHKAHCDECVCD